MKRCSGCRKWKPLEQFNLLRRAPDGRQWYCRECNAAYHRENWERHMTRIRARKRRVRAENQSKMLAYFSAHPCVDCGESDVVVLEFDHLRDKKTGVGRLLAGGYEWQMIVAEIEKCDVVCANCHRRRTQTRGGSYRLRHEQ